MSIKRINSTYFLVDNKDDLKNLPKLEMGAECYVISEACEYQVTSDGTWYKQVSATAQSNGSEVDLSNYITKDEFNATMDKNKANTIFGESEEALAANPGSAFGIAVNTGDSESIVDKMIAKGIGLYTFWISKDNADLPAEVKAKNSSCRGLCCVDTVKSTGWYGWIQLIDHEGYMYTRYIRNSVPTEWRAC